ncbi:cell division protein FtsK [Streptomyces sp. DSM 44917]|uniref:Cell division protein FtsK n=1 Tax=Streptomyces boetiae TaxID=3075541 RepID=A0ABU2L6L1_9ACTN|nr:cell division protein FtsK [Streptomyces sp. DSM 44917]MDT0307194.1 cell division protein FtsK [Streptomyces sp. DSM 44917]
MNHGQGDDQERELFARLEADLNNSPPRPEPADPIGDVIGIGSAPSARPDREDGSADRDPTGSADSHPTESGGESADRLADPDAVVLVDQPTPKGSAPGYWDAARRARRRAIIPGWVRSGEELRAAVGWAAGYAGHVAAFHAVRTPLYAVRLAARSPQGAVKAVSTTGRWLADAEGAPLRRWAVAEANAAEYFRLARMRDRRVKLRAVLFGLGSLIGLTVALALYVLAPTWVTVAAGAAAVFALGWLGAPADAPVIHRAVERPKADKLTSDMVLRALGALGITGINQAQSKGGPGLAFTAPITRDGPGWRAEGDLPHGVTVTDVIDRRERLASALRRPLGCVWPEAVPEEHTGHLVLWVGDQDMSKATAPAWPLARTGAVNLFRPVPWGTDQRGRWVNLTLMYLAGIIGAIPRMGKTFLLRLLLLIAALDPRAELHTYDLKGTGDLDPVGDRVSHRHRAGDEEEDIEYILAGLREVRAEMRRRTKVIRSLPRDICPESKVTSELADRKDLGLHPIVIGVDECQVLFEHAKHGAEFEEICTDLVKRGPATGIVLLLATQRPDAKSLPTGISANAGARWCLKVMSQVENDMVLGTSSYKRGIRATMFAWGDKGICYFVGEGADARIVRGVFADAVAADTIALRARATRLLAGTLTGHAAGEEMETTAGPGYDLLADILAVMPEPKAWNETVAGRLASLRPEVYSGWGPEQLTAALKPFGIATGQVWGRTEGGKGANRRGIERAHITAAITKRDEGRGAA